MNNAIMIICICKNFKEMNSDVYVGMTMVKKEQRQDYFSQQKHTSHIIPAYVSGTVSFFHFHSWIAYV